MKVSSLWSVVLLLDLVVAGGCKKHDGQPCVASFRPSSSAAERRDFPRELIEQCPKSSMAHVLFAFNRLTSGDEKAAQIALREALKLDAEWDNGSREYARLLSSWLAARNPESTAGGLRMTQMPLRQVMSIPGVTSGYYQSPGIDPRVSGMIDGWIDFTGTIAGIAVSQGHAGGDVMWIPGVTDGYGSNQQRPIVTVVQNYRPAGVTLAPAGTVGGDAEECRQRAQERCRAEHIKNSDVLWECVVACAQNHRGDEPAIDRCSWECDRIFQYRKKEIDEWCKGELAKCTPTYSSTPQQASSTMGTHVSVIHASDPCTAYTSCASCTHAEECGWCASSRTCMAGTPTAGASCASGWQPFPSSCTDACVTMTNCGDCTAKECGWCGANATCYAGTASAPSTGACAANWKPFPVMCP